MLTPKVVMSTSRQLQSPLLCEMCDRALSSDGENWSLPLLATIGGKFPFYDILQRVKPEATDEEIAFYTACRNPGIDVQKLTHFALGVFWKASVHSWSGTEIGPRINLGHYGEEIRKFLRHEAPFPKFVALTVGVLPPPVKQISFCQPYRGCVDEFHHFVFYVPGMLFALSVGKRIGLAKENCFYSNPLHPIVVADMSGDIQAMIRALTANAHISRNLLKYWEGCSGTLP